MNSPPHPVTYGSERDARAYVGRVLDGAGDTPASTPAYLTVNPALRTAPEWPDLAASVAGLLPGARLHTWDDAAAMLPGPPGRKAPAWLAAAYRAVIVMAPCTGTGGRRPIGPVALAEAQAFGKAGRPVLVFTGNRLVAWPDVRVRVIGPGQRPPGVLAWIDVPDAPGRALPTLAASLRVLGITSPGDVERASAGPPVPVPDAGRGALAAPAAVFRAAAR